MCHAEKHACVHTSAEKLFFLLNMRGRNPRRLVVIPSNPSVTGLRDDGRNVFVASLATAGDGS